MTYPRAPLTPTQPQTLDQRVAIELANRAADGLERRCPPVGARQGPEYELDGARVVGFCSNDYLGLAHEPAPATQFSGATGSRLVTGHNEQLCRLETDFAADFGFPDAVLFPSGYQANVATLSALLEQRDAVHSDRLNHASLIDGIRLSRATPTKTDHLATPHLVAHTMNWWITESRFSMDGDGPAADALDRFTAAGGLLYLDEAHTFGLGPRGAGVAQGLAERPAVTVVPLGKAPGVAGAFVGASATVCEYLRTTSRGFVYSTAPAPPLVAAIHANLARLRGPLGDTRRAALRDRMAQLHSGIERLTSTSVPSGPIVPIVVGSNQRALAISTRLLEAGIHVQPIRYPTVARGEARLRLTVTALHTAAHVERLLNALADAIGTAP